MVLLWGKQLPVRSPTPRGQPAVRSCGERGCRGDQYPSQQPPRTQLQGAGQGKGDTQQCTSHPQGDSKRSPALSRLPHSARSSKMVVFKPGCLGADVRLAGFCAISPPNVTLTKNLPMLPCQPPREGGARMSLKNRFPHPKSRRNKCRHQALWAVSRAVPKAGAIGGRTRAVNR